MLAGLEIYATVALVTGFLMRRARDETAALCHQQEQGLGWLHPRGLGINRVLWGLFLADEIEMWKGFQEVRSNQPILHFSPDLARYSKSSR